MRYVRLFAPVLALILIAFPRGSAGVNTLQVPEDYPTIQAAINASQNGDTVVVAPGTYIENINFHGKAVTVASAQGPSQTVIDGGSIDSVATFTSGEGNGSVLSGFTLRHGRSGFDTPGFGDGGGIRIDSASPTVKDNVITANAACNGLGISVRFGSPLILANTITANVRQGCSGGTGGGGIQVVGAGAAKILDNVISANIMTGSDGGGIALFSAGTPTIQGNVISGNTAAGLSPCARGGGISMFNYSDADIIGNLIVGNSAGCGGGVHWLVPSGRRGPLLVNNTIADNDGAQGSGVFADGYDAGVKLVNNIVVAKAGQTAVFCSTLYDPTPPTFQFNDVFAPSGVPYGGCTDQTGTTGNISADPLFVDPPGGNYDLQTGSPAIDTGTNSAPTLPTVDINGDLRIVDGDGNGTAIVDIGAVEFSDVAPPETAVTAGPSGTIAANSVSFAWTGTDDVTAVGSLVYAYRLDPLETNFSDFGSATSRTYTGLANGSYTFYVKARDLAGNEDSTPATRTFTVNVDSAAPETTITGGPTGTIAVNGASFTWAGTDDVTAAGSLVYAYRLAPLETNFSDFESATSRTYTGLANGSYTFYVKARDLAGNEDSTPATRSFTVNVDSAAPETTITGGPTGTIAVNSASFTWAGTDDVTAAGNLVYAYRLHPLEPSFSAFTSATSKAYTGLANGSYTLYVKARDEAGNEDASPASRGFTVTLGTDLVEIAVSNPPATTSAGGKFQVTDTVQNQGGVATSSSTTRYYLSKDRQRGVEDLKLTGSHSVPGLAPGATYTKTANVGIPSSVPAGVYYLLACADDNNAVKEVNEGNNCAASAASVQVVSR